MCGWSFGRWTALAGALVGTAFLLGELLAANEQVYSAFWKGGVAALLTMGLLSIGQRLWRGDLVSGADAGGVGVKFEDATKEVVQKVETVVGELNTRVDDQMTTINDRLYDLEKVVFKDDGSDKTQEE